ncbi:uncharacterized protein E0L32_010733 [Thyridium curvatum]|uniref:Ribosome production factor 2 homolog n=1 Tax=Thyridium curvatum TaxID=1093900 RepID=A0A507AMZ5_9PEZI|nr:uncharacterized protein E0L32_010733 [Thyridium curvatum]TPX07634.1 hypothetical protein E0L32_010733 [Thyridium curvatum]
MLRQIKPRNARSKRALEKRDPKAVENPKNALFLRGTSCSQVCQDAMSDLHSMRMPLAKKFTKNNPIHPFEDASSLEFFSNKNDCSLLVFGNSSKKRPHCLTLCRTFDYKILDMLELYLDPDTYRRMSQFKTEKFAVGLRPLLVFAGPAFESPVRNEWTTAKSLLVDFFRGDSSADKIDVEGLRYVVAATADEEASALRLRAYLVRTRRSGQRLPRVELEEMGPRMDFRLGRLREPDEAALKEAMRRARTSEERPKKNTSTDIVGDKMGRIHMGKQDLGKLQTRKMKGLKRSRDDDDDVEAGAKRARDEDDE